MISIRIIPFRRFPVQANFLCSCQVLSCCFKNPQPGTTCVYICLGLLRSSTPVCRIAFPHNLAGVKNPIRKKLGFKRIRFLVDQIAMKFSSVLGTLRKLTLFPSDPPHLAARVSPARARSATLPVTLRACGAEQSSQPKAPQKKEEFRALLDSSEFPRKMAEGLDKPLVDTGANGLSVEAAVQIAFADFSPDTRTVSMPARLLFKE
jgi:hypothetical protein